ncbi:ribose-phosphate diphosphokinase [Gilvimarinus sp. F26214L]|uniref:ribose-phosphate diphosphokinase n=1 Tax=Gilvimarinus sp. DZF01 TaxID=3461371 RepID=UPI004045619E
MITSQQVRLCLPCSAKVGARGTTPWISTTAIPICLLSNNQNEFSRVKINAQDSPLIFSLQTHPLEASLVQKLRAEKGEFASRQFPDGETYLDITSDVRSRHCVVLADLSHPNGKYLPLLFMLDTLRELGAASVGLVAPYLCYMRQDRRFVAGEAVTSRLFARSLSAHMDWLVTVDPHLHRYESLDQIYSVPSRVVQGAPALAEWLKSRTDLLLVGPDAESEQWVANIARYSGHPFVIGEKQRYGDRDVVVELPNLGKDTQRTAVIIDDVISSGHTVLKCLQALQAQGVKQLECAAVHGIFADGIDSVLMQSGLRTLATTNTIPHSSNLIDISDLLVPAIQQLLQTPSE